MRLFAVALDFDPVAEEFGVNRGFEPDLHRAAAAATDAYAEDREDLRHLEFVTVDPVGSMDLDQAVLIEQLPEGYRVHYAIADVAAFIQPGSPLEAESLKRGQTIYLPDGPARLHPEELSEDRASLLEGVDRAAVVWTIDLDEQGSILEATVRRAVVRSRARLNYDDVQEDMDAGRLHPSIAVLPDVGRIRQASARRRNAINLRIPSQRVVRVNGDDERFEIILEPRHPVMDFNSEISLLTGMVAGDMMVAAGRGLLRTLAPATKEAEETFLAEVAALGFDIPEGQSTGELLQQIDPDTPAGIAVQREAQKLLRGSDYVSLAHETPQVHSGVGGYYAHVTAPLRRLIDRFATEHCLAICAGKPTPAWVLDAEERVLESMKSTSLLASQVDNACLDLTEATVLAPWEGQNFTAVVLTSDSERERSRLFVADPPVLGQSHGAPAQGTTQVVTLVTADPVRREVVFSWPAD